MHELRTAAMTAKLFWIILHKTNGLLSYFRQGNRVIGRSGKQNAKGYDPHTLDGSFETTIKLRLLISSCNIPY